MSRPSDLAPTFLTVVQLNIRIKTPRFHWRLGKSKHCNLLITHQVPSIAIVDLYIPLHAQWPHLSFPSLTNSCLFDDVA